MGEKTRERGNRQIREKEGRGRGRSGEAEWRKGERKEVDK